MEESRRRVPVMCSQVAFARGAGGGLVRIRMLSVVKAVSNARVNRESRSRSRNVREVAWLLRSISRLRAAWVGPCPGRMRGHPGQVGPAGAVFDRDERGEERGEPFEDQGVQVHEVHPGWCGLGW